MKFLTPPDIPAETFARILEMPNDKLWLGIFNKALLQTIYSWNWKQVNETDITPDEAAAKSWDILWKYWNSQGNTQVEAPFYDDEQNVDDEEYLGEQTWYDEISDWVIAGFLAITFTPAASIAYKATIPRIRLAIKTGDAGTIIRVVFGAVDTLYDTFNPTPEIKYLELDYGEGGGGGGGFAELVDEYPLLIEHTGTHNPEAVPTPDGYYAQIVKGDLRPTMTAITNIRQNPESPCILESSDDNGVTWVEVANLLECPTPFDIRQPDETPCIIETTNDGGETWEEKVNLQLCPPDFEYRGGVLHYSTDGGETWIPVEVEDYDPIYDDPPPPVPRPEEAPNDKRCSAAFSAIVVYTDMINRLKVILDPSPIPFLAAGTYAGVVQAQLNFFMTGNFFNDTSANAAFQMSATSYFSALTLGAVGAGVSTGVYLEQQTDYSLPVVRDAVRCALYCAMDANGQLSFAEAIDALTAHPDVPAGYVTFVQFLGGGGLSAAISAHAESVPASECEECDCDETWCYELLIGEEMPAWVYATFGTLSDEQLTATADGSIGDAWWWGVMRIDFPSTVSLTRVEYSTQGTATRDSGSAAWLIQCGHGTSFENIIDVRGFGNPTDWSTGITSSADVSITVDRLNFDVFARCNGWSDGFAWMTKIRLEGNGENPFGEDNCTE